jgi:dTDP-glucose 4,6-dehydratase
MENKGQNIPNVKVLSRNPEKFLKENPSLASLKWLSMHRGDISDLSSLPTRQQFSHVIHAATDSTLGPQLTGLQIYDQIVTGTKNLLEFSNLCGAKRLLLTSSGAVYGQFQTNIERVQENWYGIPDPLMSGNTYGIAKRTAEHLCVLYGQKDGLQIVIARCFAFVGPDLPFNVHYAIGNFIRDALWQKEITVSGDGTPMRSYMYQSDLAIWLLKILQDGIPGQAYNVGSEQAISIRELAYLVRDIVSPLKKVVILNPIIHEQVRNVYVPSVQKAINELGLQVTIPLEEAIGMTYKKIIIKNLEYEN